MKVPYYLRLFTCTWSCRVGGVSTMVTSGLDVARRSRTCSSRYPILWVSLRLSDLSVRRTDKDSLFLSTTICAASGATARSLARSLLPAPATNFPFTSKILKTIVVKISHNVNGLSGYYIMSRLRLNVLYGRFHGNVRKLIKEEL